MTSSPTSPPESQTPSPQETPLAEGPRPPRGRSRSHVPPVTSLFQGGTTPPPTPETPSEVGGPSGSGSPLDGPNEPSMAAPGLGSSGPSTRSKVREPKSQLVSRRKMRLAARKGLQGASQVANDNLAKDQLEVDAALYVMSEEQAKMIGDPVADIAARRMSAAGVGGNPDVADGLMAIVGFAVYCADQFALRGQIKRERRRRESLGGQVPDAEQEPAR